MKVAFHRGSVGECDRPQTKFGQGVRAHKSDGFLNKRCGDRLSNRCRANAGFRASDGGNASTRATCMKDISGRRTVRLDLCSHKLFTAGPITRAPTNQTDTGTSPAPRAHKGGGPPES